MNLVIPLNMKTLLLLILALVGLQLKAQTWVQVPDLNFQNYLTAHYPAGAFSTSGGNFYIDSDHPDVQAQQGLNISSLNISSIEGVQAFENMTQLDCSHNNLTTLPVLPNSLLGLNCSYNQLNGLSALPLMLQFLNCEFNSLSSIPALPSLIQLLCNNNQLTTLSAPLSVSLQNLQCQNNQLTNLPTLPSSLIQLNCDQNQLTLLPDLANLWNLHCSYNQLTSLPLIPSTLHFLECASNHLTVIPSLSNVLQVFECGYNELTVLPQLPASLASLGCSFNQLTTLPDLPDSLQALFCYSNQLTELPELPETLDLLLCAHNQISCFDEFPLGLSNIALDNNPFTCLPNYVPAMDQATLSYPLCDINDPISNPYGCAGATGIEGRVFHDATSNCINTGQTMTYVPMSLYNSTGTLIKSSTSLANGDYYFSAIPGTYELSIDTLNLNQVLLVTCPINNSSTAIVPVSDTVVQGGDFGLICTGFDLGVQSVLPTGFIFPGQTHEVSILAGDLTTQYNMHCASGIIGEVTVSVTGPGTVTFGGTPSNVSGNNAVYSIADFGAIHANQFALNILTDTTAVSGDKFCVTVSVATVASGELDASNNLYSYCYEVVNSYDPNIKQTYPEMVEPGFDDEFTYTIYFQNTGNAPAFNIRLADTLDASLDLKTFKVVNASHDFNTVVNASTRLLTVRFPDIMLPDSTTDPQGSIGFIQYRLKPLSGLTNGTVIHNTAYIYFDYNAPIVTNTTENVFFTDLGLGEWSEETIQLYPNPAENEFLVRAEREIDQITLSDINGKQVVVDLPHANTTSVDVSDLKRGIYLVTIKTNQSVIIKRLIVR